ncbi:DUF4181 domain-containing protein [Psychrobacillus sp. NPDC096389]|uniref:DUF4181 domain-containing protein n=1 Tax=Psychrobacillus sp. NPDC096389 TaxID=3364490 RepID=UPI00380914BE
MGIFFEKVERKKHTKPVLIIKTLLIVVMISSLVLAIANEIDIFYVKIVLMLSGVAFIVDGIESYFRKEDKKVYLFEFSIAAGMFLFAASLG